MDSGKSPLWQRLAACLAQIGRGSGEADAIEAAIVGDPAPDGRKRLLLEHLVTPCGPSGKACILGEIVTGGTSVGEVLAGFPFAVFGENGAGRLPASPAAPPVSPGGEQPVATPGRSPARKASGIVPRFPGDSLQGSERAHPRAIIVGMFLGALRRCRAELGLSPPDPPPLSPRANPGGTGKQPPAQEVAGAAGADGKAAPLRLEQLAQDLELGVYNFVVRSTQLRGGNVLRSWESPTFVSYYSARAGTIQTYLDPQSSMVRSYGMELARKLFAGEITPAQVGGMSEQDLCPRGFTREVATVSHRKEQKVEMRVTSLWRCPNCKARSSTSREVFDRSLDEPASVYCTCTVCHNNFKAA